MLNHPAYIRSSRQYRTILQVPSGNLKWLVARLTMFLLLFTAISFKSPAQDKATCDSLILEGVDNMFGREYALAFENLNKAKEIAQKNGWYRQQFLALNNIGLTYFKMLDYGNAVSCYLSAYELAISNKAPIDEMIVLNNIAIVYIRDNNPKQALGYLLKSYELAIKSNIRSKIGLYATNLAQLYFDMGDYDSANQSITIALKNLDEDPKTLLYAKLVQNMLILEEGNPAEVIDNVTPLLSEAKNKKYREEIPEIHLLLSKTYSRINSLNKAEFHAMEALKACNDNDLRIKIYNQLADVAVEKHDIHLAVSVKDSIIALTNTINNTKNRELLEYSKLRFELSSSQHALEISQTKAQNIRSIYLVIILLLIPMVIAVVWAFHKKALVDKQKRVIAENSLKIKELELTNAHIQTALLSNEIEQKNKQLSDKILFQSTRNELIEEIIGEISKSSEFRDNNELYKTIRELKSHLKEDSKWGEITDHFESLNNDFLMALKKKHPDLNANETRFLSFIYLNLSNKEIASLLNISAEGCRKRKERVTAKLNLDKSISLYEYLTVHLMSNNR
jgi:tetratricopeptide (TPR) repeat protein